MIILEYREDHDPLPHEVPILKQFGEWAVHRCLAWHIGKSWETGALGPISPKTTPIRHNKACKDLLDKQILSCKTDWAAKAIKHPTPVQKAERQKRLEEIIATFTTCDIHYSITHVGAGLKWPLQAQSLQQAYTAARVLDFFLPPKFAAIFVANLKTMPMELRRKLQLLPLHITPGDRHCDLREEIWQGLAKLK